MSNSSRFPMELADRCVKCGLCLPHCPTYGLGGVEGESPRGRIALMQGLAAGRLEPGPALVHHLENCLGCRGCERVCPAQVPYGELIDAGHALLVEHGVRPSSAHRMFRRLLHRPRLLALAIRLARLPLVGLAARRLGGLPGRAVELLPDGARPSQSRDTTPPGGGIRGEAMLFGGCIGTAIDGRGLDDARQALIAAGWRVHVPPRQACCGAIDLHAGRPDAARALARRNLAAFAGDAPIVACATGCGATLLDYARLAGPEGRAFAHRVRDPAELLAGAPLELAARRYRNVVLHLPCTQRNVTGSAGSTRHLLGQVAGLVVRELATGCCGAAGETFLTNPRMSDALLEPFLVEIARDPPDALVTSNIGCAMHFTAGLRRAGLAIPVLHPASLVMDALE